MNWGEATPIGAWAAATAGGVALAMAGLYSWSGLGLGLVGFVFLALGLAFAVQVAISLGALGLFGAVILAGYEFAPLLVVLGGVTTAILAWDFGRFAIDLGAQLGREADTTRLEVVHLVASTAVGLATVVLGYALYSIGRGEQSIVALALLLVAAVLLIAALD